MSEVKTLATLVLGGFFDHDELGDIDIHYSMGNVEALQERLVTSVDDVHVELVSRIDYDAAQSELAALREERAQYQRLFNRAGDALCTIGEMLGVPEDDQSAGTTIQAVVALREELANAESDNDTIAEHNIDLQQRLTVAEQRNAELVELLRDIYNQNELSGFDDRRILAVIEPQPTESVSDACTSCDGSGEFIDAIGDWRGYCSCPAGVALKNKPTESGASE